MKFSNRDNFLQSFDDFFYPLCPYCNRRCDFLCIALLFYTNPFSPSIRRRNDKELICIQILSRTRRRISLILHSQSDNKSRERFSGISRRDCKRLWIEPKEDVNLVICV